MPAAEPPFALGNFITGQSAPFIGLVRNDRFTRLSDLAPGQFAAGVTLRQLLEQWPANFSAVKAALAANGGTATWHAVTEATVLAPLPDARQVFCTGANYGRHIVEMAVAVGGPEVNHMAPDERKAFAIDYVAKLRASSQPYVFMKTVTAIAGPFEPFVLPDYGIKPDWEIELGAVVAGPVPSSGNADVGGYMVVNDLTLRDKIHRTKTAALGPDWLVAKGGPGFLPTGPYFVPAAFVDDPQALQLRLSVNGEMMQNDSTSDMIHDVDSQVAFISSHVRVLPGDIICTGSPAGNGVARGVFLKNGDVMEAEIDGLGKQHVRCVQA